MVHLFGCARDAALSTVLAKRIAARKAAPELPPRMVISALFRGQTGPVPVLSARAPLGRCAWRRIGVVDARASGAASLRMPKFVAELRVEAGSNQLSGSRGSSPTSADVDPGTQTGAGAEQVPGSV